MKTRLFLALLCGCAFTGAAVAETLVVDDQVMVRDTNVQTPKRGITMGQVEARYGAPSEKHPTVGKPPITRWDYPNFSVFFEGERVIHAVVTGG